MSDHGHAPIDLGKQQEEKRIANEMLPFILYAALPVLLIVIIALKFGPSY